MMTISELIPNEGNNLSVGSFLKKRRSALSLTQKDVAEVTGISLPTYKQYERDGASPPLKNVMLLSKTLKFQPSDILAEAEEDQRTEEGISISRARKLIKELSDVLGKDVLIDAIEAQGLDISQDNQQDNEDINLWRGFGIDRMNNIIVAGHLDLDGAKVLLTDALGDMALDDLTQLANEMGLRVEDADPFDFEEDDTRIDERGLFEGREAFAARLRVELLPHLEKRWKAGDQIVASQSDEHEDD